MDRIEDAMLGMGCNPKYRGFRYAHQAIQMLIDDPTLERNVSKELYREAGDTPTSIERSIRYMLLKLRDDPEYIPKTEAVARSLDVPAELLRSGKPKTFLILMARAIGQDYWKGR
jgi:hypothetical protein